jgi:glycosyltransferase involved in cell wall biosynthesis
LRKRIAIITTHPIQYNAPVFQALSQSGKLTLKAFYTWGSLQGEEKYEPDFQKKVDWDIPLLEGYDYTFVRNTSRTPGSHSFWGIQNPTLIREINQFHPNAILVYGWKFASHLRAMMYFKRKIPVFFRGDSHLLNETLGLQTILRRMGLTFVYRFIDYALYVGKRNKEYFRKHGVKEKNLFWAPYAIDEKRFQTNINRSWVIRKKNELGIKNHQINFLFVGKLVRLKRLDLLILAFQELDDPNAHLIIVGSGPLEEEYKALVANHKNIHFLGFQNQSTLPNYYQLGDVLCLPSSSETWGLVANEAIAAGLALLVSSKAGCAIDLVEEGGNGFTFQSDNIIDLREKMESFTPETLPKMKKASLEKAENYELRISAHLLEEALIHGINLYPNLK